VHGRHPRGRLVRQPFRRRRGEQAAQLHEDAAATAARILLPWLERLEAVVLGGDREAVRATLAERGRPAAARAAGAGAVPDRAGSAPARLQELPYELYAAEGHLGGAMTEP
jgi:hypothetical protein